MDRKKEFKEFVRKNDYVYDMVKEKKYTWQELYEFYDIYGEDADIFKKKEEVKENVANDAANVGVLATLVNAAKNIDVNKMNEGIESIKKIAGMFSSLTQKDDKDVVKDEIRRRRYRRFDE